MSERDFRGYLLLVMKGAAMGAADVVPGVSGGTIAFISGIYEELLTSIRSINFTALKVLVNRGPVAFFRHINGAFLSFLLGGLLLSYLTLAHVISFVLTNYPVLIWSFFFGLIVASIIYIFRQLPRLTWRESLMLIVGSLVALVVNMLPPLMISDGLITVFAAAALAICAMILPGISGSFILLLLGMYPTVIDAVTEWDFKLLAVFAAGCVCGLLAFSRLLSWLLERFYSATIALLTGFLVGSLVIVWPWKEVVEVMVDSRGREVVLSSKMILPAEYELYTGNDPMMLQAVGLMILGVVLLLGLEYIGGKRKKL